MDILPKPKERKQEKRIVKRKTNRTMSKAEKFIEDYTRNCSNEQIVCGSNRVDRIYSPWLTPDQARRAVEIAREEMIEKVCMYLNEHRNGVIDDEYIINLNKAMKDETENL